MKAKPTAWISLSDELPTGTRAVLIYNPDLRGRSFPGHPVEVSNVLFARHNAIKAGYTHWARMPYPYPRVRKFVAKRKGKPSAA